MRIAALLIAIAALSVPAFAGAETLNDRVRGRILLDVESAGEAWYVAPIPLGRHYLGRPDDAFALMRSLGLGISETDIAGVPTKDDDAEGDLTLRRRLAGRILLQVEAHGEAWYVDPTDLRRRYLGRPADAFAVMRELGLGVTHADLLQVPIASEDAPRSIAHDVPFAAQAPLGNWSDRRQQEGCEEASVLMAVRWARGEGVIDAADAEREIIAAAEYQKEAYGTHEDTSAADTVDRIFKGYFGFDGAELREGVGADEIMATVTAGNVAVVPVNGRLLPNPWFAPPGPMRHMLVVTGYDAETDEFITNEPGTRRGEGFRYPREAMQAALMDYASGYHAPIIEVRTAMIVVGQEEAE
jgi:hypothetical protein